LNQEKKIIMTDKKEELSIDDSFTSTTTLDYSSTITSASNNLDTASFYTLFVTKCNQLQISLSKNQIQYIVNAVEDAQPSKEKLLSYLEQYFHCAKAGYFIFEHDRFINYVQVLSVGESIVLQCAEEIRPSLLSCVTIPDIRKYHDQILQYICVKMAVKTFKELQFAIQKFASQTFRKLLNEWMFIMAKKIQQNEKHICYRLNAWETKLKNRELKLFELNHDIQKLIQSKRQIVNEIVKSQKVADVTLDALNIKYNSCVEDIIQLQKNWLQENKDSIVCNINNREFQFQYFKTEKDDYLLFDDEMMPLLDVYDKYTWTNYEKKSPEDVKQHVERHGLAMARIDMLFHVYCNELENAEWLYDQFSPFHWRMSAAEIHSKAMYEHIFERCFDQGEKLVSFFKWLHEKFDFSFLKDIERSKKHTSFTAFWNLQHRIQFWEDCTYAPVLYAWFVQIFYPIDQPTSVDEMFDERALGFIFSTPAGVSSIQHFIDLLLHYKLDFNVYFQKCYLAFLKHNFYGCARPSPGHERETEQQSIQAIRDVLTPYESIPYVALFSIELFNKYRPRWLPFSYEKISQVTESTTMHYPTATPEEIQHYIQVDQYKYTFDDFEDDDIDIENKYDI
jgi:hypothetical protein